MKFETAQQVSQYTWALRQAERNRSVNRALIDSLFNGSTPFSEQEAEENNIHTNVNFLDAPKIAHDARNTCYNAFLKPGYFFNCTRENGPIYKKDQWGRSFTKNINRIMKRSKAYMETVRSEFAQSILHGVGPSNWENEDKWCPTPIAIGDLLIPTKTLVSLENLPAFGIVRRYTPTQLYQKTHGDEVDKNWDVTAVDRILKIYAKQQLTSNTIAQSSEYTPEQIVELFKETGTYFDSDAVPTIDLIDFYHLNEKDNKWYLKVISDVGDFANVSDIGGELKFLYESEDPFADSLEHILHIMFADGANVAPFRYHSVRGLGWLLFGACEIQNRLRCKMTDHAFENLLTWFRVSNPEDRERLDMVDLTQFGVVPEGLNIVGSNERYQINQNVIESVYGKNAQSMASSASNYRSDLNDGTTQRDQSATEIMARVNAANAMVGSMLNMAYTYQTFQYEEIVRRFCRKGSSDPDVKEFQEKCKKDGIPEEVLHDHEGWLVEPERTLGNGNKTLEIAQAEKLMSVRNLLPPDSQQRVLHIFVEALTDDPKVAEALVPMDVKVTSDATHDAQLAASALLMGLPVTTRVTNHIDYVESLLISMGAMVKKLEFQRANGFDLEMDDIMGLQNMAGHIGEHIQMIAQDRNEKERVKRYGDALGNLMNLVKAFGQQVMEEHQAQNQGGDPEVAGEIKKKLILAQTDAQIKAAAAKQKMDMKQAQFEQRQIQSAQNHQISIGKEVQKTKAEIARTDALTAAEILRNESTQPTQEVQSEPAGI